MTSSLATSSFAGASVAGASVAGTSVASIREQEFVSDLNFTGPVAPDLYSRIRWAITPFPGGMASEVFREPGDPTILQLRKAANQKERAWGNTMIGQTSNGNWTTTLGEHLVRDTLIALGENPRRPETRGRYSPDWETDDYIYEVKTRNWTTPGTAGEKVLGVMYKYSDIPELYGKPLRIVCVAYQEYELTYGPTKIFGDDISSRKKAYLDLARSQGIEYIKFSALHPCLMNHFS